MNNLILPVGDLTNVYKITDECKTYREKHRVSKSKSEIKFSKKLDFPLLLSRDVFYLTKTASLSSIHQRPKKLQKSHGINKTLSKIAFLQAAIRGWNIRNAAFLTDQVLPSISQHLLGYSPDIHTDVARVVCVELNEVSLNYEKYKGISVKLPAKISAHTFKKPGEIKKNLCRPFSLVLEMDAKGRAIHLLIIPNLRFSPLGKKLGSGSGKDVFRAQSFIIFRKLDQGVRPIDHQLCVRAYIKDSTVKEGLKIQKKIVNSVQGNFAEMSFFSLPRATGKSHKKEMTQIWYNGDFYEAFKSSSVPLDFTHASKMVPFTFRDKINIIVDVVKSLEAMHAKGYVHRDIKSTNIFLKVSDRIEGYIGDFDWSQKIGTSSFGVKYAYWDAFSERGLVYPSTDNFGLVISLCEAIVPGFLKEELHENHKYLISDHNFYNFEASALWNHIMKTLNNFPITIIDPLRKSMSEFYKGFNLEEIQEIKDWPIKFAQEIHIFMRKYSSALSENFVEKLNSLIKEIKVIAIALYIIRIVYEKNALISSWLDHHPSYLNRCLCQKRVAKKFYKIALLHKIIEPTRNFRICFETMQKELE